ncbi:MAG: hypothetical protein ACRD2Z_01270 [Thermoanaerobaculia bacterium]
MTLQMIGDEGPFQPTADAGGRKPGPLLIGCGVFLALLGVAVLLFLLRGEGWLRGIAAWSLGTIEKKVMESPPEDLTAGERRRLEAAFVSARDALRGAERIDARAFQALQPTVLEVSRAMSADGLTREQYLELAAALERLAEGSAQRGEQERPEPRGSPLPDPG